MSKMLWAAVTSGFALILTACSPLNPPEALQSDELINKVKADTQQIEQSSQYQGQTMITGDSEPLEISTPKKARSQADVGDDQEMLRSVVEAMEQFNPLNVVIRGENVWVTASFTKAYPKQEKEKLQNELQARLKKVLPRYNVYLQVKE